jgi:hypothetical protein
MERGGGRGAGTKGADESWPRDDRLKKTQEARGRQRVEMRLTRCVYVYACVSVCVRARASDGLPVRGVLGKSVTALARLFSSCTVAAAL